jgi:hypothetical protein
MDGEDAKAFICKQLGPSHTHANRTIEMDGEDAKAFICKQLGPSHTHANRTIKMPTPSYASN